MSAKPRPETTKTTTTTTSSKPKKPAYRSPESQLPQSRHVVYSEEDEGGEYTSSKPESVTSLVPHGFKSGMAKGFAPPVEYNPEYDTPSRTHSIPQATVKQGSGASAVSTAKALNPSYGKVPQYLEDRKKIKEAEENLKFEIVFFFFF